MCWLTPYAEQSLNDCSQKWAIYQLKKNRLKLRYVIICFRLVGELVKKKKITICSRKHYRAIETNQYADRSIWIVRCSLTVPYDWLLAHMRHLFVLVSEMKFSSPLVFCFTVYWTINKVTIIHFITYKYRRVYVCLYMNEPIAQKSNRWRCS